MGTNTEVNKLKRPKCIHFVKSFSVLWRWLHFFPADKFNFTFNSDLFYADPFGCKPINCFKMCVLELLTVSCHYWVLFLATIRLPCKQGQKPSNCLFFLPCGRSDKASCEEIANNNLPLFFVLPNECIGSKNTNKQIDGNIWIRN